MATTYTQNLFETTYKDDFKDSDNYHRILFNSGRALQARELTQMQTIIQKEIERFGRNIFKEGASVNPGGQTLNTSYEYVKLDTSTYALPTGVTTLQQMVGDTFTGQTSNIKIKVLEVVAATGSDPATLYVTYTDTLGGTSGSAPVRMTPGENIVSTNSVTLTVQSTNTTANPAVGKGARISVSEGSFFVQGHFVHVKPQSLVIGKYTDTPTAVVGFKVVQDVVSVSDDQDLYDNQGATLNTSAPGADRYRISLNLTTQDTIGPTENFVYFCRVINGNIFDVVTGRDEYNRIEDNIARRTFETSGNFFAKPFVVQYEEDSANTHLIAEISPGTAYINGYRANVSFPTRLRIPRAQTTISIENEVAASNYGNFVRVLNIKGQPNIATQERQNLTDSITLGGNTIGTARVRAIEKDGNAHRYYLFDIKMNSGQSFSSVRSIGTSSTQHADTVGALGNTGTAAVLNDVQDNNLFFDLRYPRKKVISDISLQVQRRFTGTADGSGNLTLSLTSAGETFISTGEWIVTNDGNGAEISASFTSAGGTSITLGNLGGGVAVTIMGKINKASGGIRSKTLTEQILTRGIESDGGVNPGGLKFVNLSKPDLYLVDSIRDSDSNGTDLLTSFQVDNGQRDNFYGNSRILLKGDRSGPASGNVYVKFKYFTHGTQGDFFASNSYVGQVDYGAIPSHTLADGTNVNLNEVLDFRPRQADSDSNYAGGIVNELPDNTDVVQFDAQYYLGRLDRLVIDQDGLIKNIQGTPSLDPKYPQISDNEMLLVDTRLNPFTINDSDISTAPYESKIFTMKDLGGFEQKLDQLYEFTTLSLLENGVANLSSLDSSGNDRTKAGFLVDNFGTQLSSDVNNIEYRAAIDPQLLELRPQPTEEAIRLLYDSDQSTNCIIKGDNVYPEFIDSVWISQLQVSGTENINPFAVVTHMGALDLSPQTDEWRETQQAADVVVGGGTVNSFSGNQATLFNSSQWNWAGTQVGASRSQVIGGGSSTSSGSSTQTFTGQGAAGNWRATATRTQTTNFQTTTTTTTSATARVNSFSTVRSVVGDRVIDVAVIPFMRSRTVSFRAQGLKANTQVFPFFDGVDVSAHVRATGFTRVAVRNNELGNTLVRTASNPSGSGNLFTDTEGKVEGEFVIPNNSTIRFRTGTREFKLLDITVNNEDDATSIAVAPFVSAGVLETRQRTVQSTRVRNIVTGTSTSSSSSTRVTGRSTNTTITNRNIVTGEVRVDGVTTVPPRTVRVVDPLAQSFFVPEQDGVFVTKVDIYFNSKDDTIPVQMQIRPMINGHPSSEDIVPGSVLFKSASQIVTSSDATQATTFTFEEPIFLMPYTEYAVVLIAETNNYNVYVAETEQFVLGSTEKRITSQPSLGSLFKSQNTTTWTADQTKDLMFQLYRAKFTVGTSTAILENASVPNRLLDGDPFTSTSGSTRIVCRHKDHGHKVSDQVYIYGLDSATTYNGILGSNIVGVRVIDSSDADTFTFDAAAAANADGVFGGLNVSTTQNYLFEEVYPYIETLVPQGTAINIEGKFTSGRSIAGNETMYTKMGTYGSLRLRAPNYLDTPFVVANDHQQTQQLGGNIKSATVSANLTVRDNFVAPVLDMQRASLWLTHNRIDNQASAPTSGFNVPINYVAETDKTGGTSIAKHITRPIVLNTNAVGLKIILSANRPSVADFKLYYKVLSDDAQFEDVAWNLIAPEAVLPSDENRNVFRDYEFLVGGKGGLVSSFTKFQLKLVMRSQSNAKPPRFRDLRVIALVV